MSSTILLLALIFLLANVVETLVGFGSALLTVAFAAALFPIEDVLIAIAVLNLPLNLFFLYKASGQMPWRRVFRQVLPAFFVGIGLGLSLAGFVTGEWIGIGLGTITLIIASIQLYNSVLVQLLIKHDEEQQRRLPSRARVRFARAERQFWLLFGGVSAGMFGTGGPFVVHGVSQMQKNQTLLRAMLAVVWVVMNITFLAFRWNKIDGEHLELALYLAPVLPLAVWIGERLSRRLSLRTFKLVGIGLLFLAGIRLAFFS